MSTWADVSAGDRVEMKGRVYTVVKTKLKGERIRVTVELGGATFTSDVRPGDGVTIAPLLPLHDSTGRQTRWATQEEHDRATAPPRGDPNVTTPPAPASEDLWELPRDRVERKLDSLLEARLVGEAVDEGAGYYVPPVDVDTVAAHLVLFHGVNPAQYGALEMLDLHGAQHLAALDGAALAVNHWHTETRPVVKS